jgi:hypothetical protein
MDKETTIWMFIFISLFLTIEIYGIVNYPPEYEEYREDGIVIDKYVAGNSNHYYIIVNMTGGWIWKEYATIDEYYSVDIGDTYSVVVYTNMGSYFFSIFCIVSGFLIMIILVYYLFLQIRKKDEM